MKTIVLSICAVALIAACVAPHAGAQAPQTKYEFSMYQVVLLKHGPNWKAQDTDEGMDMRMKVIANIQKAAEQGLVVSAGLVNDETDVEIIIIFNIETKYEALELARKAPAVKSGFWKAEIYSWFAPKGLAVTSQPRPTIPGAE